MADPMAIDPEAVVDHGMKIPKDPTIAVAPNGTGVELPPETSVARALHAPNMTLHRRTTREQMPPGLSQRLPVGTPLPVTIHGSREKLPQNSHHEVSSARPPPSLRNDVFNTPDANIRGVHLILRSLRELDPANPLTPMVNQVKTLLDAAQIQVTRANNPRNSRPPVGTIPARGAMGGKLRRSSRNTTIWAKL